MAPKSPIYFNETYIFAEIGSLIFGRDHTDVFRSPRASGVYRALGAAEWYVFYVSAESRMYYINIHQTNKIKKLH